MKLKELLQVVDTKQEAKIYDRGNRYYFKQDLPTSWLEKEVEMFNIEPFYVLRIILKTSGGN
jgi:hypothetical protein